MKNPSRLLVLGISFCLIFSTVALACHSNYFNEVFTKIQKQNLTKNQLAGIIAASRHFDQQKALDHRNGFCSAKHDSHEPEFIAAAAGVLDDQQFKNAIGRDKTEVQKLRFEVNQLKSDLAEIKDLLKKLEKKS